jgi:outer membrane protein OmpA-like peptidoglycan-associated protein
VQTADQLIGMLEVSPNMIEEKKEEITNHQIFEEKTDDRNDLKGNRLEIPLSPKPVEEKESNDIQVVQKGIDKVGVIVITGFLFLIFVSVFLLNKEYNTPKGYSADSTITVVQADTVMTGLIQLPDGNNFPAEIDSFEDKIVKFISDDSQPVDKKIWFDTDRLIFASGSQNLKEESNDQIENIAYILKAFPNVKIKIGCYSDNVGNPKANLKLTNDRALTVMSAIIAKGIDPSRMYSEGYGVQNPIASNDTEEGRAKNRRLAISVRAK